MRLLRHSEILENIRAAVFDLDDTLYPEIQYVHSGFAAVARAVKRDYGVDCAQRLLELFDENKARVFDRLPKAIGISFDNGYVEKLVDIYRTHKPILSFYADVQPLLSYLRDKDIKLGIITDGRVNGQRAKLEALDCYSLFDCVIITDELGGEKFRKPATAAFELMCAEFGVELTDSLYVGDNPAKDFYIGSAGMITVRIKRKDSFYIRDNDYYNGVKEKITVDGLI